MDLQINISTPRLHLRLMEESDAKDVLEILGDKETAELGGISSLSTLDDAIDYIQGYTPVGYLVSIVKDNPQGEVVGIMEVYPKYLFFGHEAPQAFLLPWVLHEEDVEFYHVDNPYQLAS